MSLSKEDYYTPQDFSIGQQINVHGRDCIIYDCDNFTKAYYKQNFGVDLHPISL